MLHKRGLTTNLGTDIVVRKTGGGEQWNLLTTSN
jgi:hypothetical protein